MMHLFIHLIWFALGALLAGVVFGVLILDKDKEFRAAYRSHEEG